MHDGASTGWRHSLTSVTQSVTWLGDVSRSVNHVKRWRQPLSQSHRSITSVTQSVTSIDDVSHSVSHINRWRQLFSQSRQSLMSVTQWDASIDAVSHVDRWRQSLSLATSIDDVNEIDVTCWATSSRDNSYEITVHARAIHLDIGSLGGLQRGRELLPAWQSF